MIPPDSERKTVLDDVDAFPVVRRRSMKAVTIGTVCLGMAVVCGLAWFRPSTTNDVRTSPANHNTEAESDETNWPQFRGPSFDAISKETDLADSWPESGPPVLWTRELGQGYSSFAAVGNRLFTQYQSIYQQSVVCLDADTGQTIWSYNCGWPFEANGLYPGPRSTPTWHAGHLYFATPDGTVGCLNAENGRRIWSCNPKKMFDGRGTDFGYASSPVIIGGRVIVLVGGPDACLVALDCRNGAIVWKSGESPASYATPLPILWKERSIVVAPLENSIVAVDTAFGKKLWEINISEGYDEHSAALLYQEPFLCIAAPFRAGAKCYELRDDDQSFVNELNDAKTSNEAVDMSRSIAAIPKFKWESPKFSNDVSSSVLVGGRLYGFDLRDPQSRLDRPSRGEFRCLNFETGQIIWSTNEVGQASPIVADQKLILFNDRGEVILARIGTDEYSELARTQLFHDEVCWTSPALHRGRLFLRTQTRAVCLYLGKDSYQTPGIVRSVNDIPRGRTLSAKWLIGGEREFPATVPEVREFLVWYLWSLVAIVLASIAEVVSLAVVHCFNGRLVICSGRHGSARRIACGRTIFWLLLLLAGMVGSPLINARQNEYVLLWPLALWTAFQLTINVITITERHPNRRQLRWYSRGFGVLFIGVCVLYFSLCRSFGYAIEWSFLVGFLPAFVVAAVAARCLTTHWGFWLLTDLIGALLSFTGYFWLCVLFIKWKFVVGS